jgi:integrase
MGKTTGLYLLKDRTIAAAKVGSPELKDGGGLVLRILPSSAKCWNWRGRVVGEKNPVRISLGEYPATTLVTAREIADQIREAATKGNDPRNIFKQKPKIVNNLRNVVDRWQRHAEAQGTRSAKERVRSLELHVLPILGDEEVTNISKGDVFSLIEDLRDGKGVQKKKLKAQANRVLSALKTVMGYAYDADLISANPIAGMKPQINEVETRHKVVLLLNDLLSIWQATDNLPSLASPITKLLILTGLRREEITGLRWDEFNKEERTITIREERFKGKRDHRVPLSQTAITIIQEQPRYPGGNHIFSVGSGRGSFTGWRRAAKRLCELADLEHNSWHIHDIRRGVATAWGEHLDAREETTARLLGHSGTSRMGITATYEKSERIKTSRQHVEAWDTFLHSKLTDTPSNNVVSIKTG